MTTLSSNIVELDQCLVLVDGDKSDFETFFETVEQYLLERIQKQQEEVAEVEPLEVDMVVETKVINVNKTSKHDNQHQELFCWGTFLSDSGTIEKRSFVN